MTHRVRLGSYTAVLLSILLLAVVLPVLHDTGHGRTWLPRAFLLVVLGACLSVVVDRRRTLATLLVLLVLIQLLTWEVLPVDGRLRAYLDPALGALFLAWVLFVALRDVVGSGAVTADKVVGAAVAFLLLGLLWARLHALVAAVWPAAYATSGVGASSVTEDGTYFSFVTLTTLGYGDVVPVAPTSRAVAWLEAVTGQLYVAIIVARLVALHIVGARAEDGSTGGKT